jgi:hypothetical protein
MKEYPMFFSLLFIPGAIVFFKRRRNEAIAVIASLACLVLSVVSVATPPNNTEWLIKPYLVSANVFTGILSAMGLFYFFLNLKTKLKHALFYAVLAAIFGAMLVKNNPHYDRYFIGYDYGKSITLTAGKGAVVFTEGDMNIGAILYETLVNKEKYTALIPVVLQYEWYRRQVTANYPGMFVMPDNSPDMKTYLKSIIAANRDRNIFYSNVYTRQWLEGLTYYTEGLLYRIKDTPGTRPVSDLYLRLYSYRGLLDDKTGYDEFTQRLVLENYGNAFTAFAETLRAAGQLEGAVKFYNYGLLFNRSSAVMINMGLSYYYLKDFDNAARVWQEAADFDPKNPLPYINIAFIYLNKKDITNALAYLDRALAIDPYNANAMQMKAQLGKQGEVK